MGGIGFPELIIVLAIALLVFGAGKLPKVMGDVAKGVKNFKSGLKEDEDTPEGRTIEGDNVVPPTARSTEKDETTSRTP